MGFRYKYQGISLDLNGVKEALKPLTQKKNLEATDWHTVSVTFFMCLLHEICYRNILAQFPNENKIFFTSLMLD